MRIPPSLLTTTAFVTAGLVAIVTAWTGTQALESRSEAAVRSALLAQAQLTNEPLHRQSVDMSALAREVAVLTMLLASATSMGVPSGVGVLSACGGPA